MGVESKPNPLVSVKNLCLDIDYTQPSVKSLVSSPREILSRLYIGGNHRESVRILDDISFELFPGDRLGVLGENGAGKSTLLKTVGAIYPPSSGSVTVNGTMRGLFAISLGMNDEATGIENIFLRGLQMRLSLAEIRECLDSVGDFSELGDALHRPIGTYSTGMKLRLAFAISTMVSPDVLLLDEWIGSGDIKFRKKADARMKEVVGKTKSLILASHSISLLNQVCNRGIVLQGGRLVFGGKIEDAIQYYEDQAGQTSGSDDIVFEEEEPLPS